jgi:hypothetical protein
MDVLHTIQVGCFAVFCILAACAFIMYKGNAPK